MSFFVLRSARFGSFWSVTCRTFHSFCFFESVAMGWFFLEVDEVLRRYVDKFGESRDGEAQGVVA